MIIAGFGYGAKLSELSEEVKDGLRKLWPGMRPDSRVENYYDMTDARLTIDEAAAIEELTGIKLEIKSLAPTQITKLEQVGNPYPSAREMMEGKAVIIHVAELGLLHINETEWLDDCCTEELQRHLDDGWRILAVCPPQAQRRPDYILGRTKREGK